MSLIIHRPHRKSAPKLPRRLNTARLKDPVAQQLLASKIKNALELVLLDSNSGVNNIWEATRDAIYKASLKTLGTTKRHHQDWFDENDNHVKSLLEHKRTLQQKTLAPNATEANKSRYRDGCPEVQAILRTMRDEWWDEKAAEVQGFADRH